MVEENKTLQEIEDDVTQWELPETSELANLLTGRSTKNGGFVPDVNVANTITIFKLLGGLRDIVRYNTWLQRQEFFDNNLKMYVPYENRHDTVIQNMVQQKVWFLSRVPKNIVVDAIEALAYNNQVDTAQEYINSLDNWDKKDRLSKFCVNVFGAEDNDFNEIVGHHFWLQMIDRIMNPGCKVDNVLVVVGEQGIGKTRVWESIAGRQMDGTTIDNYLNYTALSETDFDNINFITKTQGSLICEFSEGISLKRAKEVEAMKDFITRQVDRATLKHMNHIKEFPRRFVLTMAVNEEEFLKDVTGDRRYIPIEATVCSPEYVFENRNQLFAEAYYRLTQGEQHYQYPEEELARLHKLRTVSSPQFEKIVSWLERPVYRDGGEDGVSFDIDSGFTVTDIWEHAVGGKIANFNHMHKTMLGIDLAKICGKPKRRRKNGIITKVYFYTGDIAKNDKEIENDLTNISF